MRTGGAGEGVTDGPFLARPVKQAGEQVPGTIYSRSATVMVRGCACSAHTVQRTGQQTRSAEKQKVHLPGTAFAFSCPASLPPSDFMGGIGLPAYHRHRCSAELSYGYAPSVLL